MYNLCRNHASLDDIDTKSSARCFQGHNLHSSSNGLRTRFWLYPFSLQVGFLLTQFKGDDLFQQIFAIKNMVDRPRGRAEDHCTWFID